MSQQSGNFLTRSFPIGAYSIAHSPWRSSIQHVLQAALTAADPYFAVQNKLSIKGSTLQIGKQRFDLNGYQRIRLIGMGKACIPMAAAVQDQLADRISDGLLVVKAQANHDGPTQSEDKFTLSGFSIIGSSHPIPDERSLHAGSALKNFLAGGRPDDLVICLVSGGGSALVVSPEAGIELQDIQLMTRLMLACGATIQEINTLRKHLDEVKGGGLACWAYPASLLILVLSDVLGDPLDVIASGPAHPDSSNFQDAWNLIKKYQVSEQMPERILAFLRLGLDGKRAEKPRPGEPIFSTVQHVIIGNNRMAATAALNQAKKEGFHGMLLTSFLQGEARQAGIFISSIARELAVNHTPLRSPTCIVMGGETTVTLTGSGLGGRNQELALGSVMHLANLPDTMLVTLATDGEDGPTNAAGAVVTGDTLERAQNTKMNPQEFLINNDSYHFFENLEDLVITGPTHTNVNDLALLFRFK